MTVGARHEVRKVPGYCYNCVAGPDFMKSRSWTASRPKSSRISPPRHPSRAMAGLRQGAVAHSKDL